jgi:hypothetical protein
MDSKILITAIRKAIEGGAVAAPPIGALGQDASYVRTQTDVGIEPTIFNAYVAELKADADMAAFDGTFANVPHGGGVSVGLPSIARLLLAQAIVTKDVEGTVKRFGAKIAENTTDATAVMAVSGIKVNEAVQLGTHTTLIPMTNLAPSPQRGMALGQQPFGALGPRFAVPCALITKFRYGPVFYRPKSPQPPEEMAAHVATENAHSLLAEASDLLALLGVYPRYHMYWVQADDWLMSSGTTGGWQFSSTGEHFGQDIVVPRAEAEALGAAYFALHPQQRGKMLRIPLDRLGRAGRERDFADRAIDLGIALESLLLHDIKDHGELSFRLSLRGAWLIGASGIERREIQSSLKRLYDLRSRSVHSGFVEPSAKTGNTISRATEICKALIQKVIELKCNVDWQTIVVGGNSVPLS